MATEEGFRMPRHRHYRLQSVAIAVSLLLLGYWFVVALVFHVTWLYLVFALPASVAVLSLYMPDRSGIKIIAVALGLLAAAWWTADAFAVQPYAFAPAQLIPLAFAVGHLISVVGIVYR